MTKILLKKWIKLKVIVCLLSITCIFSCTKTKKPDVSFYYWKTIFEMSDNEKKTLKDNNVSKIYVRYFDVVIKDKYPIPSSPIRFYDIPEVIIVPVIYIKNEVFLLSSLDLALMSIKITDLIEKISFENKVQYAEIQIDCDWTLKSKENYLHFINLLKTKSKKNISTTIRLHQIKYFKETGIPSVDRGVLMYYNIGIIGSGTANSIYDRATALKYIQSFKKYPLPLNIALPIYSWAIHLRNNRVIGLVNKVDINSFITDSNYVCNGKNIFDIKRNNIKLGHFFESGDKIKIESISPSELQEMCKDLNGKLVALPNEIIFYDLDDFNLKNFNHEKKFFQKLCASF